MGEAGGHPERVTLFVDGQARDLTSSPESALHSATDTGGWVWVEIVSPDPDQWKHLSQAWGLNRLAVEDMQEQGQRTKLEQYGEHAFMVLHPASYDDAAETVRLGEIDVYLGHRFVVTHRAPETPAPERAWQRVSASRTLAGLGPRGAGYALLDEVVDGYQPVLDGLSQDIDEIDDELFSRSENDVASRIYRLSRQVGRFQRAVAPLETVLTAARKALSGDDPVLLLGERGAETAGAESWAGGESRAGAEPWAGVRDTAVPTDAAPARPAPTTVAGAPRPRTDVEQGGGPGHEREHAQRRALLEALLRDVQDHARRIDSHTTELHSTLSNGLSLAMTLASERATEVSLDQSVQAKKVSSWAAIFAAPTVLAGVWGMNFRYMPELEATWGYPAALATMAAACGGLYLAFKKRNWL